MNIFMVFIKTDSLQTNAISMMMSSNHYMNLMVDDG